MRETRFDGKQVIKYLVWTFSLAYLIQAGVYLLYQSGNAGIGSLVMAAMMYVPAIGVLLSGRGFADMGWKPMIRRNIRWIMMAWFIPAMLTAIGAALYFLVFPGHFDLSGSYMTASAGEAALEQLKAQGLTYPMYILISVISCLTYAPLMNTFVALGEEIGWRGFLYPQLRVRFGCRKGWLLGGIIRGADRNAGVPGD